MKTAEREGRITRRTRETQIEVVWRIDGGGESRIESGIGFLDHMLSAFARHGYFDLRVKARGDLHVDGHHTVEDVGITMGMALDQAIGEKEGLRRFGEAHVPMDEALVLAVIDLSGRPFVACEGFAFDTPRVGEFDTSLFEEFFRAFAANARATVHLRCLAGRNAHHMIEAAFKAAGRALDAATGVDDRLQGPLSTKGSLS